MITSPYRSPNSVLNLLCLLSISFWPGGNLELHPASAFNRREFFHLVITYWLTEVLSTPEPWDSILRQHQTSTLNWIWNIPLRASHDWAPLSRYDSGSSRSFCQPLTALKCYARTNQAEAIPKPNWRVSSNVHNLGQFCDWGTIETLIWRQAEGLSYCIT